MISVADATMVLHETTNVRRKTLMEKVRRLKTQSARALMAQTIHVTSHFWGVLTQWPWGCILVWSCLSVLKLSFRAVGSAGAAGSPHGAGR